MGVLRAAAAVRLYRGQIPSPGRPTVAWREDRVRFWVAIARGRVRRMRGRGDRRVVGGRVSLVSSRWRGESDAFAGGVRAVILSFARARRHRVLARAGVPAFAISPAGSAASPSTISRELRRNASTRTYRLDYRASIAQWHAERRARRPKVGETGRQ